MKFKLKTQNYHRYNPKSEEIYMKTHTLIHTPIQSFYSLGTSTYKLGFHLNVHNDWSLTSSHHPFPFRGLRKGSSCSFTSRSVPKNGSKGNVNLLHSRSPVDVYLIILVGSLKFFFTEFISLYMLIFYQPSWLPVRDPTGDIKMVSGPGGPYDGWQW